ncbi:MAG TPA: hypothetical protein VMA34_06005 [Terracidiphilus sp.]|nr:hypothetical protein [Terracidiphilus sp.]
MSKILYCPFEAIKLGERALIEEKEHSAGVLACAGSDRRTVFCMRVLDNPTHVYAQCNFRHSVDDPSTGKMCGLLSDFRENFGILVAGLRIQRVLFDDPVLYRDLMSPGLKRIAELLAPRGTDRIVPEQKPNKGQNGSSASQLESATPFIPSFATLSRPGLLERLKQFFRG